MRTERRGEIMTNGKTRFQSANRPRRAKKADRLRHGVASEKEIRADYAVAPFDKMVRDMDRKWGVDRLPEIVSPEMAAKYGSALAKLCAAIEEGEPEMIAARANVCMRGMAAMDAEAVSLGRAPAELDNVWIMEFNGIEVGLMKDARHWPKIMDHHPGLELITENEVITALAFWREAKLGQMVNAAKESFEGAEIIRFQTKEKGMEDDVPF